jgi:hypothetical protein
MSASEADESRRQQHTFRRKAQRGVSLVPSPRMKRKNQKGVSWSQSVSNCGNGAMLLPLGSNSKFNSHQSKSEKNAPVSGCPTAALFNDKVVRDGLLDEGRAVRH